MYQSVQQLRKKNIMILFGWMFAVSTMILLSDSRAATAISDSDQYAATLIPEKVQVVDIWRDHRGLGSYKFEYNTGLGKGESFREEERNQNGTVQGKWGYLDDFGVLRVTEYRADSMGFHIVARHVLIKTETFIKPPRPAVNPSFPFIGPLPPFIPKSSPVQEE
ncbi:uncharacterized protein LOC111086856 [Limulus polyphemus]|uniref:Uncharacterized protein LOC111086856 n=1 Tax=Limulus polyphemus TaxID=6850 RepID=A0ABM1SU50_LIMPO|nr:uncharacterized protein LOC111086856 [Limulus polyphemus]